MRTRTEILRLREYAGRCLLTHKRLPDAAPAKTANKHRIETETLVSDGKALAQVFASLASLPHSATRNGARVERRRRPLRCR